MTPEFYMELAYTEALKANTKNEVPIGAILVDTTTQKILARAHNLTETSKNALNHAEKICIERAMKKLGQKVLPHTMLFTTLEPCPLCATAISFARIPVCYFSTLDTKAGAVFSHTQLPTTHPHFYKTKYIHLENMTSDKSQELLKNFFTNLRKKSDNRTSD